MSDNNTQAKWVKTYTVGPRMEIKISSKGFIGFFVAGRWANGVTAEVFATLVNHPDQLAEIANTALETKEGGKAQREQDKLDAKLRKEAEALMAKAERLQQAGIDFAAILNARKQA